MDASESSRKILQKTHTCLQHKGSDLLSLRQPQHVYFGRHPVIILTCAWMLCTGHGDPFHLWNLWLPGNVQLRVLLLRIDGDSSWGQSPYRGLEKGRRQNDIILAPCPDVNLSPLLF